MSLANYSRLDRAARFPRVSGDEPGKSVIMTGVARFSPRERG